MDFGKLVLFRAMKCKSTFMDAGQVLEGLFVDGKFIFSLESVAGRVHIFHLVFLDAVVGSKLLVVVRKMIFSSMHQTFLVLPILSILSVLFVLLILPVLLAL